MIRDCSLAQLLWILRRYSGLYMLGAGASAPIAPFGSALFQRAAWDYVHLGSFPVVPAPRTFLNDRVYATAKGLDYFPGREVRLGTPAFPSDDILLRFRHSAVLASMMYYLAQPRFAERRIANYTIFRAFYPSVIITHNVDGLAADTCGVLHRVADPHGTIEFGYGGPRGAEAMRLAQQYAVEIARDDLILSGPESFADDRLHRKLQVISRSDPAFVVFIGYSFGKYNSDYDDRVSLETFIAKFRGVPVDVYVLDPHPMDLAEMLHKRLKSDRVHAFPVYWNVLAEGFTQVLSGRLCPARLGYFHDRLLDKRGPDILFPEIG